MTELDEESIKIYGKPLQGKYKHFCIEFDYLPIDERSFEFQFCHCFEDAEAIQFGIEAAKAWSEISYK